MIVYSGTLSKREKILIVGLILIVALSVFSWFDVQDPQRKYKMNESYCKDSVDCAVIYDMVSGECRSVNGLHKDRYEWDSTCRGIEGQCFKKSCIIGNIKKK